MITKAILDWKERKFEELDPNSKHAAIKAFGLGAIEGFVDGAVFAYPMLVVSCLYWKNKALKK